MQCVWCMFIDFKINSHNSVVVYRTCVYLLNCPQMLRSDVVHNMPLCSSQVSPRVRAMCQPLMCTWRARAATQEKRSMSRPVMEHVVPSHCKFPLCHRKLYIQRLQGHFHLFGGIATKTVIRTSVLQKPEVSYYH